MFIFALSFMVLIPTDYQQILTLITMFTVQVIDRRDGKPLEYKTVAVHYSGFFGGITRDVKTDSRGEAHFDYKNGKGKIYVGSKVAYEGDISGRIVVYV